jgi:hypothetical protein
MKDAKRGTAVATPPSYNPIDCPGNPKAECEALNVWGTAWEAWGNEVRAALRSLGTGGPTNVSPPPPPPFNP